MTKEKTRKKPVRGLKFKIRMCALALACLALVSFVLCTMFAGDKGIISYLENYVYSDPVPINPDLSFKLSDEKDCYEIYNSGDSMKILQLTDVHLGCGFMTTDVDRFVVDEVFKCVKAVKPDFIVLSGDILSPIYVRSGTKNSYLQLEATLLMMKKIGLPWAYVFGNHDSEGMASKEYISETLENTENCYFLSGEKELFGSGNYLIKEYNADGSTLISSLFFMDSGGGSVLGYDGPHDDQIEWYKKKVLSLNEENPDAKSLLFLHIPLPEYETAWNEYENGSENVEYFYGVKDEGVSCGQQRGLYEKIKTLGNTRWIFCGHDHKNNFSILVKSDNVRLTFGMSMDYSAYVLTRFYTKYRGGTVITVKHDYSADVTYAPQEKGYVPQTI